MQKQYTIDQQNEMYKILTVLTASCVQKKKENAQHHEIPGKLVFIVEMLYTAGPKRQRDIF